jgi:hypothetical protein
LRNSGLRFLDAGDRAGAHSDDFARGWPLVANAHLEGFAMNRASDQIGVEEIRRRVQIAINAELLEAASETEDPAKLPKPREMARRIHGKLDAELLAALAREELIRLSRKILRLLDRGKNHRKQSAERAKAMLRKKGGNA